MTFDNPQKKMELLKIKLQFLLEMKKNEKDKNILDFLNSKIQDIHTEIILKSK